MVSQGLRNTVKADKVDLRFDIAGLPVWNCVLCLGYVGIVIKKMIILRRLKWLYMYTY